MSARRAPSLQGRLLWSLMAAILLAALLEAALAYRTALAEVDLLLDDYLQRMAWSLRAGPMSSAPDAMPEALSGVPGYDLFVQVWSGNGLRIFESDANAALPSQAVLGFANVRTNGTTWRVFSLQAGDRVIQVAQDLASRRITAGAVALRTLWPIALMAPLLMFVTVLVVHRSLRPVAQVRRQVAQRQPDDLSAVSPEGVPQEVRPLVDELNLLLARVQRAFEAQQHFVSDAAHELRSPLAALRIQLQGLQRARDDAARSIAIERLAAGLDRATRLVEQLLVLARQEARLAGGEPLQPVDLAALARSALIEIAPVALQRGVDVGLGTVDPAVIEGHSDALEILLRNLLENAVKYTPAAGRVDVEVLRTGEGVTLAVDDSGPGVAPEERARVLARFGRGREPAAPGSGLGLAIVETIAELHGTHLELGESLRHGGLRACVRFRGPERAVKQGSRGDASGIPLGRM